MSPPSSRGMQSLWRSAARTSAKIARIAAPSTASPFARCVSSRSTAAARGAIALGDELAHRLEEVAIELRRVGRVREAVLRAPPVLGDLGEARPVDGLFEVEAQIVVVEEEAGHRYLLVLRVVLSAGGTREAPGACAFGWKRLACAMRASSRS